MAKIKNVHEKKKKKPSNIMRVYVDDVISYAVSGSVNWHKPLRV